MRVLSDWLKSYKEYTIGVQEGSTLYHTWVGIGILGCALKQNVKIDKGRFDIWPNNYIMLLGGSASRKTVSLSTGKSLLKKAFGENLSGIVQQKMGASVLIEEMVDHCQYEEQLGRNASTVSLFMPEFKGMLPSSKEEVKKLIDILTECYDFQDMYRYRMIGKDKNRTLVREAENVLLNMMAASTPDWLKDVIGKDEIGGGFASRILFIYANDKGNPVPSPEMLITSRMRQLESDLIQDLAHISQNLCGCYELEPAASARYEKWYCKLFHETNSSDDTLLSGYIGRKPVHTMRTAMLLAASRRDELIITLEDFNDALHLVQEVESSLRELYLSLTESGDSRDINTVLKHIPYDGITRSDLLKKCQRIVQSSRNLDIYIKILSDQNDIQTIEGKPVVYRRTRYDA